MTIGAAVAVCNQKGGVGKTTSVLNLASAATAAEMRVLVVDLDPQANASQALGWPGGVGAYEAMTGASPPGEAVHESAWEGVDVMPSVSALALLEAPTTRATALAEVLVDVEANAYDLVLIDCPPSVGRLTLNALVAARLALVVTTPAAFASEGVIKVVETIQVVQANYNPELVLAGIVCNLMPPRGREADLRLAELRALYGGDLWEPVIPRRTVVEDAIGARRPLSEFGPAAVPVAGPYATHLSHLLATMNRKPRRRR